MDDGQFKKKMEFLNKTVLEMGDKVERLINTSFRSLMKGDLLLAQSIMQKDQEIDSLELKINEECLKLLALYQSVASDLRFITTAMAIVTDLERIGDLAIDVANRTIELGKKPNIKPIKNLPNIVEIVGLMIRRSLTSYVRRDTKQAKEVIKLEEKARKLFKLVYEEISRSMEKDPKYLRQNLSFVLVTHHVERIAGHVTNIAEDVVYMIDAEIIKYKGN